MNFIANLLDPLGCIIGHIKCATNAEGTETIKRDAGSRPAPDLAR